jgi:hypothetical protein
MKRFGASRAPEGSFQTLMYIYFFGSVSQAQVLWLFQSSQEPSHGFMSVSMAMQL